MNQKAPTEQTTSKLSNPSNFGARGVFMALLGVSAVGESFEFFRCALLVVETWLLSVIIVYLICNIHIYIHENVFSFDGGVCYQTYTQYIVIQ